MTTTAHLPWLMLQTALVVAGDSPALRAPSSAALLLSNNRSGDALTSSSCPGSSCQACLEQTEGLFSQHSCGWCGGTGGSCYSIDDGFCPGTCYSLRASSGCEDSDDNDGAVGGICENLPPPPTPPTPAPTRPPTPPTPPTPAPTPAPTLAPTYAEGNATAAILMEHQDVMCKLYGYTAKPYWFIFIQTCGVTLLVAMVKAKLCTKSGDGDNACKKGLMAIFNFGWKFVIPTMAMVQMGIAFIKPLTIFGSGNIWVTYNLSGNHQASMKSVRCFVALCYTLTSLTPLPVYPCPVNAVYTVYTTSSGSLLLLMMAQIFFLVIAANQDLFDPNDLDEDDPDPITQTLLTTLPRDKPDDHALGDENPVPTSLAAFLRKHGPGACKFWSAMCHGTPCTMSSEEAEEYREEHGIRSDSTGQLDTSNLGKWDTDTPEGQAGLGRCFAACLLVPISPVVILPFLTHVVPMTFYYCWYWIAIGAAGTMFVEMAVKPFAPQKAQLLSMLLLFNFVLVYWWLSAIGMAVLHYGPGSGYLPAITTEWEAHETGAYGRCVETKADKSYHSALDLLAIFG